MDWLLHQIPVFEKIDWIFWVCIVLFFAGLIADPNWRYEKMRGKLWQAVRFYFVIGLIFFAIVWNLAKAYPPFKAIDLVFWVITICSVAFAVLLVVVFSKDGDIDDEGYYPPRHPLQDVLVCAAFILFVVGLWFLIWLSIKYFWFVWLGLIILLAFWALWVYCKGIWTHFMGPSPPDIFPD